MPFYGSTAAVKKNSPATEMQIMLNKALQLKDGPLELPLFAKLYTDMLNQGCAKLMTFAEPCIYYKWRGFS